MVIDGDFTSDKWKSWIKKLVELKPYFNDDTNSTLLADGLARFQEGEAAMVFASPGYLQTIKAMTEAGKNVGVMKVPSFAENPDLQRHPDRRHARIPGHAVRHRQGAGRELHGVPAHARTR